MEHIKYYLDWLFKDLHGRNGKYIIAEAPNVPLIAFMISIVLAVIIYPGFFQRFFAIVAYLSLIYWGYNEIRGGRSRFRKLLGWLGIIAAVGAFVLRLGL